MSQFFSAATFWHYRDEANLWPVFLVAAILNGSLFALLIWWASAAPPDTGEIVWEDEIGQTRP